MADELQPLANKSKGSKVEVAKEAGQHLRGTIAEALDNGKPIFEFDDLALMKFHGIYQQDDRDTRDANKVLGLDRDYSFMIRIKIPGGMLTADQYLGIDKLAERVVYNHGLRITSRQNIQLHGVLKGNLKDAIREINATLLSTLCGCGDVERNVMAPPAPYTDEGHVAVRELAKSISDAMCPKTNAYYEVWMDGEKVDTSKEEEPLYREAYLPRKFKTAVALPEDNSIEVQAQDCGLLAIIKDGKLAGANVFVGGSMGMTHKKAETYARLATLMGYVDAENIIETVQTVAAMFRDYGDRTDRAHARLKYVVEEFGIEKFRNEFQRRVSFALKDAVETPPLQFQDYLGKHDQGDGKFFYGLYLPDGRVLDGVHGRYKPMLRKIVQGLKPRVILTPTQNIIFADLSEEDIVAIERILGDFDIATLDKISGVKRYAMACVALPTCGLALTESERVMPEVIVEFEEELGRMGLENEPITIRMTGCPNGCARPYTADIGLVGHKPGHYDIFIGGRIQGNRMAQFFSENVPLKEIVSTLRPLLEQWGQERHPGEALGDFFVRLYGDERDRPHIVTGSREDPAIVRLTVSGVLSDV